MNNWDNAAGQEIRAFIERVERLSEEKDAITADIREVLAEAKARGYDPRILREVIKLRKQDANERAEREALLDTYLRAIGMQTSLDV